MNLHIQDPADPQSSYLLDTLRDACDGAEHAGGAFAFLSAGGVKLFFQDEAFQQFTENGGQFSLLAGVDAITDTKAISALSAAQELSPALQARIHVPIHARSIFHPKFAWFQRKDGSGTLVTGSGNLTAGGLLWNVEAFSVAQLQQQQMSAVVSTWTTYLDRCHTALRSVNDPEIKKRLERNAALQQALKKAKAGLPPEVLLPVDPNGDGAEVDAVPAITPGVSVLVAEIPKSGNRWKQANFDLATFTGFFGASTTEHRVARFFNVSPNGALGPQEVRPAVAVASQNYRFELEAAAGLDYPEFGRPIGVFVRIAARTFLYVLLMPGDEAHGRMSALLDQTQAPAFRLRRLVFGSEAVKQAWPDSPLWNQLAVD